MTAKPHRDLGGGPGGAEPVGALLARARAARGFSQLRLAELLCAAAGTATVSRHEVSRWERQERVPGPFWRRWLSAVLEIPPGELEAAAARARRGGGPGADRSPLWQPPSARELLTALDEADHGDLRELAHAWLTGPPGQEAAVAGRARGGTGAAPPGDRLRDLRRMDDLVGGADLAAVVDRELRAALAGVAAASGDAARRRALAPVAELAQLAGWVRADAGDTVAARRAYRVALRAAAAAGARALAAHVLGALSHLALECGDPQEAMLLARSGYLGAGRSTSRLTRVLLLHRVALAAAHAGERGAATGALATAERLADRVDPGREPDRLYWLDPPELAAMTGRCLAASGRPLRAVPLLARERPVGPRTAALYAGHLAHTYLALGEVEQACEVAARALTDAVRSGSARAAAGLHRLRPRLLRHRDVPAVRGYHRLADAATPYLPRPTPSGRPGVAAGDRPGR